MSYQFFRHSVAVHLTLLFITCGATIGITATTLFVIGPEGLTDSTLSASFCGLILAMWVSPRLNHHLENAIRFQQLVRLLESKVFAHVNLYTPPHRKPIPEPHWN